MSQAGQNKKEENTLASLGKAITAAQATQHPDLWAMPTSGSMDKKHETALTAIRNVVTNINVVLADQLRAMHANGDTMYGPLEARIDRNRSYINAPLYSIMHNQPPKRRTNVRDELTQLQQYLLDHPLPEKNATLAQNLSTAIGLADGTDGFWGWLEEKTQIRANGYGGVA